MSEKKDDGFLHIDTDSEHGYVYRPPKEGEPPIAENATVGVRFSQNVFIQKSLLDQWKVNLDGVELDNSCMGSGIYMKDSEGNITDKWTKLMREDGDETSSL